MLGASSWSRVVPQSFDNVVAALAALLELSTTEGWFDVMIAAVDSTTIDAQPRRNANEAFPMLYFVVFMIVGCFFCTG